jgi:hypothetical protein
VDEKMKCHISALKERRDKALYKKEKVERNVNK